MIRFTKARATPPRPRKPQGGKADTLARLKAFLSRSETDVTEILVTAFDAQQNTVTYTELREAYLAGGITQKQFEKWQKDYTKLITDVLAPKWAEAAAAGAREVTAKYPYFRYEPSVSAGMSFLKQHGAELVTNLVEEQRQAINAVIRHVSGYTAVTADEAARIIRPCVGLTKPQAMANARYREAVKQAYIEAHPRGKQETAEKRADEAAARYAGRQHRYRAQNIARTELAFAYNAGAYGATRDAQARGYIGDCVKVWLTAYDERVCPVCSQLDDEKRNMDEAFSNGKLLPPAHPSCRCAVSFEEIPGTNMTMGQSSGGADPWEPGTIEQTGTVDFSDKAAVLHQLKQAQIDFAGLDHEMNCTVTSDGKVWRVSGTSGQVNPWGIEALGSSLRGSYSYHNHPAAQTWYSFSAEDVRFFFAAGEEYAVAADDVYAYVMRRTKETLDIDPESAYRRFDEIYKTEIYALSAAEKIDIDADGFHETIARLSKEYMFFYERVRLNGN